jgi:hypothetical protein
MGVGGAFFIVGVPIALIGANRLGKARKSAAQKYPAAMLRRPVAAIHGPAFAPELAR